LVAVASVGIFLTLMLVWFLLALVFRWRFQYSLLSLLVLMVTVALPFGWLGIETKKAKGQKEAVEWIRKAGGNVLYDCEPDPYSAPGIRTPSPTWLRELFGEDLFADVAVVSPFPKDVSDAGLDRLEGLTQLRQLSLDGTEVTDAGLEHCKALTQLQVLNLSLAEASDAGLEHLKGLTQLHQLCLNGTKVSGAGLEYLKRLPRLSKLFLSRIQVTRAGVKKLQQALPNCLIFADLPSPRSPPAVPALPPDAS
jgi:hypothetical protein